MKNKFKNIRLSKIKRPIKVYKINSFDVETYNKNKNISVIGIIHKNKYHKFFNKLHAQEFIKNNSDKMTLWYATNLGFDYNSIYFDTPAYLNTDIIMRNGNIITARIDETRFSDSINYAPFSVEKLGELINLKKIKYKERIGLCPENKHEWRKLIAYNKRDCEVTKKFMDLFQQTLNNLGCELKLTIASCSMDLYRRKYMPCDIYKERFDCKKFILKGYYGGRVEAIARGKISTNKKLPYYLYDFSSLYPSVMLYKYPFPSSAKLTYYNGLKYIKKYMGMSKVIIKAPKLEYQLLPYRSKGKLLFPYGIFKGVYTHEELNKAITLGYEILKVEKTIYYTKEFYPFKEYVIDLYNKRLQYINENNIIMSTAIKLLLNSLYGKFAMKTMQDYKYLDYSKGGEWQIGDIINHKTMKGYRLREKDCNQNYIMPIFSAYVTSYGRIKLYDELVNLKALYCDTDSIISRKLIPNGNNLGQLKIEKIITKGMIIKPKVYMVNDIQSNKEYVKIKGFKKPDFKMFNEILDGNAIPQQKFLKVREATRRGFEPNDIIEFTKEMDLEDDKRVWNKSFNRHELQWSKPKKINRR